MVIRAARGEVTELKGFLADQRPLSEWRELAVGETMAEAIALNAIGRADEAAGLVETVVFELERQSNVMTPMFLPDAVDILLATGRLSVAERLARESDVSPPPLVALSGSRRAP